MADPHREVCDCHTNHWQDVIGTPSSHTVCYYKSVITAYVSFQHVCTTPGVLSQHTPGCFCVLFQHTAFYSVQLIHWMCALFCMSIAFNSKFFPPCACQVFSLSYCWCVPTGTTFNASLPLWNFSYTFNVQHNSQGLSWTLTLHAISNSPNHAWFYYWHYSV